MTLQPQILVFKTNVLQEADKERLLSALLANDDIVDASIDLEDCDKILRIVTHKTPGEIQSEMYAHGFTCIELE